MIALNETDPTAAEIPFFLPLTSDPFNGPGLTGHVWTDAGGGTTAEVQVRLPGGTWHNAVIANIVEKGFGRYCVQLTSAETTAPGTAYIHASVTGAQPYTGDEDIGLGGGDFPLNSASARIPFFLANSSDPVFGSPVTGHSFTTGEVKVRVPGGSYADASTGQISEVGDGLYELLLTTGQTARRGKIFLYALVTGAQRYEGYATVLDAAGAGAGAGAGGGAIITVPSPISTSAAAYVDHVALALSRLPHQFRSS